MAAGTITSRILGLAKAILLAYAIGSVGAVSADAYANGNLLPNTLYMVLLGGMLNAVLVPQIVNATQQKDGGTAYINKILTLITTLLIVLTAIALTAAPALVWITATQWDKQQLALATTFAYWCIPQIIFYGLYTVLGEVLNAKSIFGPFTWAPALNNIIAITGIATFIAIYGADPYGQRTLTTWTPTATALLGATTTLGVAAQALILFISWQRANIHYRPDFRWRGMGLNKTARIAGWSLATIGIMQLSGIIVGNVLATGSGAGPSISALDNVWLIFMMPHSVIAVSLGTAYFTRLAKHGQTGQTRKLVADFSTATRQITLIMVLAATALSATAPHIARIINFGATQTQTEQFAQVVQAYLLSLAAYSFLFIVQRAFYALNDTRTPFLFTAVQLTLVIIFALLTLKAPKDLIGFYIGLGWSIATLTQTLLATFLLRRKIGYIDGKQIAASVSKYVLAAIPALFFGHAANWFLSQWMPGGGVAVAVLLSVIVALFVSAVYLVMLLFLRSREVAELVGVFRARFHR